MLVTYTGKVFDFDNITKDSIYIDDVIHSLTKINRFIGHSSRAYSVAEHTFYCLLMAEMLGYSVREKLLTFVHDFTEAYVGDCPSPLKRRLPMFSEIEAEVETAIYEHLEIEPPTEEEYKKVKRIDMTMLVIEMRDLTLHSYEKFVDQHTYLEMLDDDNFKLKHGIGEDTLKESLHVFFNNLMKQYKEEIGNV